MLLHPHHDGGVASQHPRKSPLLSKLDCDLSDKSIAHFNIPGLTHLLRYCKTAMKQIKFLAPSFNMKIVLGLPIDSKMKWAV